MHSSLLLLLPCKYPSCTTTTHPTVNMKLGKYSTFGQSALEPLILENCLTLNWTADILNLVFCMLTSNGSSRFQAFIGLSSIKTRVLVRRYLLGVVKSWL